MAVSMSPLGYFNPTANHFFGVEGSVYKFWNSRQVLTVTKAHNGYCNCIIGRLLAPLNHTLEKEAKDSDVLYVAMANVEYDIETEWAEGMETWEILSDLKRLVDRQTNPHNVHHYSGPVLLPLVKENVDAFLGTVLDHFSNVVLDISGADEKRTRVYLKYLERMYGLSAVRKGKKKDMLLLTFE